MRLSLLAYKSPKPGLQESKAGPSLQIGDIAPPLLHDSVSPKVPGARCREAGTCFSNVPIPVAAQVPANLVA
jgi:hypothetical protein